MIGESGRLTCINYLNLVGHNRLWRQYGFGQIISIMDSYAGVIFTYNGYGSGHGKNVWWRHSLGYSCYRVGAPDDHARACAVLWRTCSRESGAIGTDTLSGSIPEIVFVIFQMTFAVITPALIVGAYPERVNFPAVLLFSGLWLLFVYFPVCHWIWVGGWLAKMGVMDFAGGLVVHLTAGVSALVIAVMVGARRGFPREVVPPHNPGLVMIGAALLWVGWFGFNGGSTLAANGGAGMAILVTHISAAAASLAWMTIEWIKHGKPSLVGFVTGTIAGLATITPASGFVGPVGGLILGLLAAPICYAFVNLIKQKLNIDDSLDVFAVHGVGGLTGTLLTAFLAVPAFGGLGLAQGVTVAGQFQTQLIGAVAVAAWSIVLSVAILAIIRLFTPLRVSEEDETEGLDVTSHGERGYNL